MTTHRFRNSGFAFAMRKTPGGGDRAQRYQAEFRQQAEAMLSLADLKKVGERWWSNLEPELMKLVRDPKNEEIVVGTMSFMDKYWNKQRKPSAQPNNSSTKPRATRKPRDANGHPVNLVRVPVTKK